MTSPPAPPATVATVKTDSKACEVCCLPATDPLDFWETPDGVTRKVCMACQGRFLEFTPYAKEAWLQRRRWVRR